MSDSWPLAPNYRHHSGTPKSTQIFHEPSRWRFQIVTYLPAKLATSLPLGCSFRVLVSGFVCEIVYEPDFQRHNRKVRRRAIGPESTSEAIMNGFAATNYPPFRAELRAVFVKKRGHPLLSRDPFEVARVNGFASFSQAGIVGLVCLRVSRLQRRNGQSNCQDD